MTKIHVKWVFKMTKYKIILSKRVIKGTKEKRSSLSSCKDPNFRPVKAE